MIAVGPHVGPQGIVVRPIRRRDIPAVVRIRHSVHPDDLLTPESFAWTLDHERPSEQARRWVATERGAVVGIAAARRAPWYPGNVAHCHVAVDAAHRGRGIGARLASEVERHLDRLHPTAVLSEIEHADEPSAAFARHRGFRHTRDAQVWSLDPRTIALDELPARIAAAAANGYRLVPVRLLLDRPKDLFELNRAVEADLPTDLPIEEPYDEWRTFEFDHPLFSPDASFGVLAGDQPVAFTWVFVDAPAGRAGHGMTGTVPGHRHRGLARLVKLATIDWLASHGVTVVFTDNDTTNVDMLALNEHLGYRRLTVFGIWMRGD